MSTTFTLGLNILPNKLFMGMDERSSFICSILQSDLAFPRFVSAGPGSTAWTSKNAGVIATVRYAEENLAQAFERLSGVAGRLFVSLDPSKQFDWDTALTNLFGAARQILLRTECDAALILDWEHVILRRIRGEISMEEISHLFPRRDSRALLRQLDPFSQVSEGFD